MRILVIADEIWNDQIHGNNILTNWFLNFPAEFAMITCSPGEPYNSICKSYFQITDGQMLKSLYSREKAGSFFYGDFSNNRKNGIYNSTDIPRLEFFRKNMGNLLRLFKTIVWNYGKIDEQKLEKFIHNFNPDIIFSARFAHSKILRIEKIAKKYAKCPIVAFTGDNEYSLRRFSFSLIFWFNLFYQRKKLKKAMPTYSLYYTLSERQILEFKKHFDIRMKILRKCATKELEKFEQKKISKPIQIVYGGKLYQGRDKTLVELCKAIKTINIDNVYIQLHIYTGSDISNKMYSLLHDGKSTFLHRAVPSEELKEIYKKSDIALSVESFKLTYKLATRLSFSTKLIDCLASTCAVMMIGWKENSGFQYLDNQKAAICIGKISDIETTLRKIISSDDILIEYQKNAYYCLKNNHDRDKVQAHLYEDLKEIIDNKDFI